MLGPPGQTTGHRSNDPSPRPSRLKIDIANHAQAALLRRIFEEIDPNVNDGRTRFDPLALYDRNARRNN